MDHVSIRTLKNGGYVLTKKLKNLFQRPNVIANITNGSLILKSPSVTDRLEKVVQFRQLLRKIPAAERPFGRSRLRWENRIKKT